MQSHWPKAVCLLGCQLKMFPLYSCSRLTLSLTLWLTLAIGFVGNVKSPDTRKALTHRGLPICVVDRAMDVAMT